MNNPANYEQLVKVLILGDIAVGKSNFLLRFTDNTFVENYISTVGYDYKSNLIKIDDNKAVKLQVWDTAGQERFLSVNKNLLLRVQGVILMYDITDVNSFNNTKRWFESIRENIGNKMPIVLVGNKCDLEANRKVSYEKAKFAAEEMNVKFFESSARNNINVKEVYLELTKEIIENYIKGDINNKGQQSSSINLKQGVYNKDSKPCC